MLDATNTFLITDPQLLSLLPKALAPSRYHFIQRLDVHYNMKLHPAYRPLNPQLSNTWKSFWRALASMQGLCHLRVKLWDPWHHLNRRKTGWDLDWFEPVKGVTRPRVFVLMLSLPALVAESDIDVGETACVIVRCELRDEEIPRAFPRTDFDVCPPANVIT